MIETRKEALIVGVANTRGYAEPLPGAKTEAKNWADLLTNRDGFTKVTTLIDSQASRDDVLTAFKTLLTGAKPNDQLLFVACCHGRVVPTHSENKDYPFEEALIVWPNEGDSTLRTAEITDSDLAKIVREVGVPEGTDFGVIVDACWAAYFDFPLPPGAKRMFILPVVDFDLNPSVVREFGSLSERGSFIPERPVVVAACGREEQAVHLEEDGVSRLAFSREAIKWLYAHEDATFATLCKDIRPTLKPFYQTPEVRGNKARENELFPGEAPPPQPLSASALNSGVAASAGSSTSLAATVNGATQTLSSIDVTFKGICCFAGSRAEADPYQKRVLLPYDDRFDPDEKHIAFIEVSKEDCTFTGAPPTATEPHYGAGFLYHRWHLRGHRIVFANADTVAPLRTTWSYEEHVAGMKTDVFPYLEYHPKAECFDLKPPATLVGGYVDLACGILTAGPLEPKKTRYVKRDGSAPTSWYRRAPQFVLLQLPLADASAVIFIYPPEGEPTMITVSPGGSVLIGNLRLMDIYEDPNATEEPREHFKLYYKLSATDVGDDPPLPQVSGVPVNNCSVNDWP